MMHLSNLTVWEIWQRGPGCQCPHYQVAKSHSCQEVIRYCCPGTTLWSLGDKDSQTKDWHILWTTAEKSEHALGCCSVHQKPTKRDRTVYYVTVHSPELCLDHNVAEWYGRLKRTGRCFVCLQLKYTAKFWDKKCDMWHLWTNTAHCFMEEPQRTHARHHRQYRRCYEI